MDYFLSSDLVETVWKNIPFFIPVITALVICIIDLFWRDDDKDILVYLGVAGLGGMVALLWPLWLSAEAGYFLGFPVSRFSLAILMLISVVAILTVLLGHRYYYERGKNISNFVVYFLFATFGIVSALATSNLMVIFVGLVLTSIALTFLLKFYEDSTDLNVLPKFWIYFLVTDLLFCLGVAFFYGATGSLDISGGPGLLDTINQTYTGNFFTLSMAILGVVLMAKMAAVPFHWWILDLASSDSLPLVSAITVFYRGALMLVTVKIFAPLVNMWGGFFEVPIVALAIVTMTWANLAAVRSRDLRLMLIYSSIAHVGYFLALFPALMVDGGEGLTTIIIFVVAFAIIHLGAFALLHLFSEEGRVYTSFDNLDGLGKKQPWVTLVLCLFLFALAGAPPLVTFVARFMMIREIALSGNYLVLGTIVINMAIAVFYYTRPMARMFLLKPTKHATGTAEVSYSLVTVIVFSALIALYLGIQPASFINWVQLSVAGM